MDTNALAIIILAAGKGTRMKTGRAKVLCLLAGVPLIHYVLNSAQSMVPERIIVVIGFQAEEVKASLRSFPVEFVYQEEQLGTGHAVLQTYPALKDFQGDILVLSGDVPLLTPNSLNQLLHNHRSHQATISFLTTELDNPSGYGRVIRDEGWKIVKVVEEKDATPQEKEIKEINSGIYCFQKNFLYEALALTNRDNQQGEYYLTDLIQIAHQQNQIIIGIKIDNPTEVLGINTMEELVYMESFLQEVRR
jgi:UDP-N-acetylglucosamine diphosphorylase/glucosamine-1-phosphate N-acetyltransferase